MKKLLSKKTFIFLWAITLFFTIPQVAYGMHISEGFLPVGWCAFYFVACIPFVVLGVRDIRKSANNKKDIKMLIALIGAFAFVLSAMKIPSVTGSCSHPTGVGLAAILFGPSATVVLGTIVLLFQALLLAHGGITTLGANAFSMAIVGPLVSFGIWKLCKDKMDKKVAVFLAAALGDLLTYTVTSFQLGLAFPDPAGGFMASAVKFLGVFFVTQVPIAIAEGLLTVIIYNFITENEEREVLA